MSLEASAVLSCPFRFFCTRNTSERLHTDVLTTMVPNRGLSRGNCPSMRSRAGKYKPEKCLIRSWETCQHVSNMTSDDSLTQKTLLLFHRNEGLCFQQMAVISHLHVNSRIKRSFLPQTGYQQMGVVQIMEQSKPCDWRTVCWVFCVHVYTGWWETLNDVTSLDKLCFGSPVWKMKQLCLVIPASEEMSGTGREKCIEEASEAIMIFTPCGNLLWSYALPQKEGETQFVWSGSETSPRKVCLINAFSFPTDRCGEVCGKLCCSVTQLELPGQQEHSCRGQQVKRMLFV